MALTREIDCYEHEEKQRRPALYNSADPRYLFDPISKAEGDFYEHHRYDREGAAEDRCHEI